MTQTQFQPADATNPSPVAPASSASAGHGAHGPYDSDAQRRKANTLGMWLFLTSEVMMFSGLFCLYAIFRNLYPEIFHYGSQFLDRNLGMVNTIILLMSSFTMAVAVTCAQRRLWRWVLISLGLTLVCGAIFLGIKAFEYQHKFHKGLLWGEYFTPPAAMSDIDGQAVVKPSENPKADAAPVVAPEFREGFRLYTRSCSACHGRQGEGIAGAGLSLAGSAFFKDRTEQEVVAFVKEGRPASDPQSVTGLLMPPNGGNPRLRDTDLTQIVRYLRSLEPPAEQTSVALDLSQPIRSLLPAGNPGPAGLTPEMIDGPAMRWTVASDTHNPHTGKTDPSAPPRQAYLFFSLYFVTTGLHALHMTIGMGVILYLAVRIMRNRRPNSLDDLPIEMTSLYWHLVDIIWIIVFPLYYLIH